MVELPSNRASGEMKEGLDTLPSASKLAGTYRYSRVYPFLLTVVLFALSWRAVGAVTRGHQPVSIQHAVVFAFGVLCTLGIAVHFYRYKAVIEGATLRVGSFRPKQCNLREVIATDLK